MGAAVGVSFAEKFGEQVAGQKPVAAVDVVTYLRGLDLALDQSGLLQLLEVLRDGGLGYGQYFVDLSEKATLLRGKKVQDGHPGRMAHRFGKAGDLFLVFRIAFRCHLFSGVVRKYTNIWPHLQIFPAFFVRCRAGIFRCRGGRRAECRKGYGEFMPLRYSAFDCMPGGDSFCRPISVSAGLTSFDCMWCRFLGRYFQISISFPTFARLYTRNAMNMDKLIETIVSAIEDKKGKNIVSLDLSGFDGAICSHFIVCNADSTTQVCAIADGIEERVLEKLGEKVWRVEGQQNGVWVAMDYVDVVVHIFQTELRGFYKLEELWADAPMVKYEYEE